MNKKDRTPTKKSGGVSMMNKAMTSFVLLLIICSWSSGALADANPDSLLRSRGYSVIPAPQQVVIENQDLILSGTWKVISKVGEDLSVTELKEGMNKLPGLSTGDNGAKVVILQVVPGTVRETNDPALNDQGYVLRITIDRIIITANTKTGVFYGVQSLLQLLHKNDIGQIVLPLGEIRDWPDLQLRFVHWDTKHHLDKIAALKQYLDRLARVKINMVAFEIWDKFKFPTDPDIGVKDGFTPAELQELVDYGLARHIQIVPDIQAPAHMQWLLHLKKYAHLKADVTDQQACMCDPEFYKLLFSLYQDIINATKGVEYFFVSTDEVYNAGICKKCGPFTPENRSLAFVIL